MMVSFIQHDNTKVLVNSDLVMYCIPDERPHTKERTVIHIGGCHMPIIITVKATMEEVYVALNNIKTGSTGPR